MKSFGQYITESLKGNMLIGWISPRDKMYLYRADNNKNKYHTQIITRLLSYDDIKKHMGPRIKNDIMSDMGHFVKDGDMTQDQIDGIIENSYKTMFDKLSSGKIDGHFEMEESLSKSGWVKIRIDRKVGGVSAILCEDLKRCHKAAKILDKEFGGWQGLAVETMYPDDGGTSVRDEKTWEIYLKTGQVPKRTDIGRTMAQFR